VERALAKVPGVTSVSVNLATERASIETLGATPREALHEAIERAGYEVSYEEAPDAAERAQRATSRLPSWWPVALAAVLTLPLVAPMAGSLFGRDWMLPAWAQLLLATP